ncbi:MAG: DUF4149 domain-containing protein [Pseudomonadota bacterium]|nr:DUF4149 domain-containing protein [Pseudomonadota bacterium]
MHDTAIVAALLSAVALGAMLFFSFAITPLIFLRLPTQTASGLVRDLFPVYYIALAAVTAGAGAFAGLRLEGILIWLTCILFLLARFVLVPAMEKERSGRDKSPRFVLLHRVSMVINLAQMVLLAVAAMRLAG